MSAKPTYEEMVGKACATVGNKYMSRASIKAFLKEHHGYTDSAMAKNALKKALVKFERKGDSYRVSKDMKLSGKAALKLAAAKVKAAQKKRAIAEKTKAKKLALQAKKQAAKQKALAKKEAMNAKKQALKEKLASKKAAAKAKKALKKPASRKSVKKTAAKKK